MPEDLPSDHLGSDPVVVLTGASSGIGHATALALARHGARLVLAARGEPGLQAVASECRDLGAEVEVVPTDVTDPDAVERLGEAARARFGHVDAWINGVGVGAVGRFDEVPISLHRRVIEANLMGHLHGAHVALRQFRQRGRGTLVNVVSIGGYAPTPGAAAYGASKAALRGLDEALRAEVADLPGVHVCEVSPTFVDTPGMAHGANRSGHRVSPPPPLLDPREVAAAIVSLLDRPRPRVMLGSVAWPARVAHAVAPDTVASLTWRLMRAALDKAPEAPFTNGNLFEPSVGHEVDGGYRAGRRASRRWPWWVAGAAAVALGAGALAAGRRRRSLLAG